MAEPTPGPAPPAAGWDSHVHVFDAAAPLRPGHYTPGHHPLAQIEALAGRHGIGHLVLVQPSVYGADASVLLRALAVQPGRHRGVVVADEALADGALLARLHEAGVRGVRFNCVSPAGQQGDPAPLLRRLAPHLRACGWHCQWYVPAERLGAVAGWQAETGLPFVLDHLAGLHAGLPPQGAAWQAAAALAAAGAWVKLSGWYRLAPQAPYASLHGSIARVGALFGTRLLWGSDWPHTSLPQDQKPGYASLQHPVRAALGEVALQQALGESARSLYW